MTMSQSKIRDSMKGSMKRTINPPTPLSKRGGNPPQDLSSAGGLISIASAVFKHLDLDERKVFSDRWEELSGAEQGEFLERLALAPPGKRGQILRTFIAASKLKL